MPVEVRLPTVLRQNAAGQATITANGSNLAEVFEDVVRQFPLMAGKVVTEEGTLHKFVNVYRNDEDVRYLQRLDTAVSDADVISILPAVAGG
ncbi:MAG: MoaD/ThiS family protein [Acidimicrobiales bacterium]